MGEFNKSSLFNLILCEYVICLEHGVILQGPFNNENSVTVGRTPCISEIGLFAMELESKTWQLLSFFF